MPQLSALVAEIGRGTAALATYMPADSPPAFKLSAPLTPTQAEFSEERDPSPTPKKVARSTNNAEPVRLLVVEDDDFAQMALRMMLDSIANPPHSPSGSLHPVPMEVTLVSSAEEAIKVNAAFRLDAHKSSRTAYSRTQLHAYCAACARHDLRCCAACACRDLRVWPDL